MGIDNQGDGTEKPGILGFWHKSSPKCAKLIFIPQFYMAEMFLWQV